MTRTVMRTIVVAIAGAGVLGQLIVLFLIVAAVLAAAGRPAILTRVRRALAGRELWLACAVAGFSTAGSLFFSEAANFPPCAICWYERYCMYPMGPIFLGLAAGRFDRAAGWLLPLPVTGSALAIWHLLIENSLAPQTVSCLESSPGGCGLKWITEFGYVTIPTLALTGFLLITSLLILVIARLHDGGGLGTAVRTTARENRVRV